LMVLVPATSESMTQHRLYTLLTKGLVAGSLGMLLLQRIGGLFGQLVLMQVDSVYFLQSIAIVARSLLLDLMGRRLVQMMPPTRRRR
ncbi:MAG: hypothetical protein ACEQSD_10845, partial [Flavobacteriales bacterium]